MQIYQGTTWKTANDVKVRYSGNWIHPTTFIRHQGQWRELLPPNVVVLQTQTPTIGNIANGTNGTPNLLDKYMRHTISDFLSLGGTESHNFWDHTTKTLSTNGVGNAAANVRVCCYSSDGVLNSSGHGHSSRTMPYAPSYVPSGSYSMDSHESLATNYIPVVGADYFETGSVIYSKYLALNLAYLVDEHISTYYNSRRLFRFGSSYSDYGSNTHTHSVSGVSGGHYATNAETGGGRTNCPASGSWNSYHGHNLTAFTTVGVNGGNFTHNTIGTTVHRFIQPTFIDELPSGKNLFLIVLNRNYPLPTGWEHYNGDGNYYNPTNEGHFLGISGNTIQPFTNITYGSGDLSSHIHSGVATGVSQSYWGNSAKYGTTTGSTYTRYRINSHTHKMNISATGGSFFPRFVNVGLITKP